MESDIIKNESSIRNLSKYLKAINNVFDRYKLIRDNYEGSNQVESELREFCDNLSEFKKANMNNNFVQIFRKLDNMTSLTLKSEYSEDASELLANKINSSSCNEKFSPTKKASKNESFENLMDGLKRINTESSKMKSTKKITNKKLKYSDLDITENKIKHISNINVVKTKKKNSNNFTKSRTSFNKKIDNSPRIKSNQINKKDVTLF